ncbi:hypothetical protein [Pseudonocardia endophytica]|uniref:Uncharacterized protein n=1 Tax=Pseudonocardia endophytica TaxID=401976 RepID=A0A4R1HXF3_PSEEN|nr:hypothetical protein [Pseudonocardia endophytica]TCK22222.1 hypothetical protein EV378_6222 [Pseudonocardia endophytica]
MNDHESSGAATTDWIPRLTRLADDVDVGLPPRATSDAIRAIVTDLVQAQHRAAVLANVCGGTRF